MTFNAKQIAVMIRDANIVEGYNHMGWMLPGDIACHVKALAAEVKTLQSELISIASFAATAKHENTPEWMEGLVEKLNHACNALNDADRFQLKPALGESWIEKCSPEVANRIRHEQLLIDGRI